jgi:hypothetical protein
MTLDQIQKLLHSKGNTRMQRQPTEGRISWYSFNNVLIARIYKGLKTPLNPKSTSNPIKMGK